MPQIYFEDFMNKEDIEEYFEIKLPKKIKILFAYYTDDEYSGYEKEAFILFEENSKLYEVNGHHCSCYGLEGQWEPEETTKESLLHRIEKGNNSSFKRYSTEIKKALNET